MSWVRREYSATKCWNSKYQLGQPLGQPRGEKWYIPKCLLFIYLLFNLILVYFVNFKCYDNNPIYYSYYCSLILLNVSKSNQLKRNSDKKIKLFIRNGNNINTTFLECTFPVFQVAQKLSSKLSCCLAYAKSCLWIM